MAYILFLGARSDIAKAVSHEYAKKGFDIYLAGRNLEELNGDKADLEIRHKTLVTVLLFNATDYISHKDFYDRLEPKPIGTVCAVGYLGDQKKAEEDFTEAAKIIETNYTGCVSILNIIARDLEKRREGFIIGISSVAGDRGRGGNYIYGSAKAGFTAYLSGLRNRLHKSHVQVLTVKPGFVNTKMTAHLKLPPKLTAEPEEVAKDIFNAQQKGKDILYTKRVWRIIMLVIKHIPETIFKRLSL